MYRPPIQKGADIVGKGFHRSVTLFGLLPPFAVPAPEADRVVADVGQTIFLSASPLGVRGIVTFVWTGLPGCTPQNSEALFCQVVEVGTFSIQVRVQTTGGQDATSPALTVRTTRAPAVAAPVANPNAVFVGEPLNLSVTPFGGASPLTFVWNGLPTGCNPPNASWVQCSPSSAGTYVASVAITDAVNVTVTSPVTAVIVSPGPALTAPTASRSSSDVGQDVQFATTTSGDLGQGEFDWTGLPSGCPSSNSSTVTCVPAAPSNSSVHVRLTYATSLAVVSLSTNFTVFADPTVSAPVATPLRTTAGQAVSFAVRTTPGSGGDLLSWHGLEGACASVANTAEFSCTLPAGNYSIYAVWTDSNGFAVTSSAVHIEVDRSLQSTPPNNGTSLGPDVLPWVGIGILGVSVLAIATLVVLRGRRASRRPMENPPSKPSDEGIE